MKNERQDYLCDKRFVMMSKKVLYFHWRDILIGLLKTYRDMSQYPFLDSAFLPKLKERLEDQKLQ